MSESPTRQLVDRPVPTRLPTLTGLRFVAAFLVFTSHVGALGFYDAETTTASLPWIFGAGWAGVEFFFILSGFVLAWSARSEPRTAFWRRRLAKIYPNHLVTWAAALALALAVGEAVTAEQVLPSLFLVHTWVPYLPTITSINVPSWSLSVELLFYLSFPWVYALVQRIRPGRLWWWAGGLAGIVMLLPALVWALVPADPALPGQQMSLVQNWLLVSFPPTRVLDFTLGIVMARIVVTGRWVPLRLPAAAALVAVGFVAELLLVPTVFGLTLPLVAPLALLVAAAAVADVEGHGSPLRSRTAGWLGEVSFAVYLLHFLVLKYGLLALGGGGWSWPVATLAAAALGVVTLLLSWALYAWVEKPAMRRFARPRPGPAQPGRGTPTSV